MNELAVKQENSLNISDSTKDLIKRGVSKNTLAAYRRALTKLDTWLSTAVDRRELNDGLLAEYLTHLHESGKFPATISQVVAAVKWQPNNLRRNIVGVVTALTPAGIRHDGRRYADCRAIGRSQMPAQYAKAELAEQGAGAIHLIEL